MKHPVQSAPIRKTVDWSMAIARLAMWAAIAPFGILWWGVNGGFSVIGLEDFSASFGPYGKLFYTVVIAWQFDVPFEIEPLAIPTDGETTEQEQFTLPETQPVLPWGMVAAGSVLQIVIIYRKLRGKPVPVWMYIAGALLSIYDLGTTYFGVGTLEWVKQAGQLIQLGIAPVLTFGLELLVGILLRPSKK